jgi:predicted nucleotide-binding protein
MSSPDPSLFIGSSSEGLSIARALQAELDEECEPLVWEQGFFVPTGTTIGTLTERVQNFDFAAFVFTPDDSLIIKGSANAAARDNVILELGIFIGALGKERVFIVHPRDQELHLPSDLAGVTCLTYRSNRKDRNLRAAVGPAATAIRNRIVSLGIRRTLGRNAS